MENGTSGHLTHLKKLTFLFLRSFVKVSWQIQIIKDSSATFLILTLSVFMNLKALKVLMVLTEIKGVRFQNILTEISILVRILWKIIPKLGEGKPVDIESEDNFSLSLSFYFRNVFGLMSRSFIR